LAVNGPVDTPPEVATLPPQPPLVRQELALVEDQFKVAALPEFTWLVFVVNVTVGGGGVFTFTVTD